MAGNASRLMIRRFPDQVLRDHKITLAAWRT